MIEIRCNDLYFPAMIEIGFNNIATDRNCITIIIERRKKKAAVDHEHFVCSKVSISINSYHR
jgi:hypothetical protein